jgi:hypothetical protein
MRKGELVFEYEHAANAEGMNARAAGSVNFMIFYGVSLVETPRTPL